MIGIDTYMFLVFSILLSLGSGALSFLSPCVLPIFPAYLSYITGVSVTGIQGEQNKAVRKKLLTHSIFFLIGVSLVFVSLGVSASCLWNWLSSLLVGS